MTDALLTLFVVAAMFVTRSRSTLGTALDCDRVRRIVGSGGDDQERGGLAAVVDP